MSSFIQDLRYAVRSLGRARGFSIAVALTLALGIGANTAIYSVVHHVVFNPFPFINGNRLVAVWEVAPGGNDHNEMSAGAFRELRETSTTMDRVVAHAWANANITGGDGPERVQAFRVSPDFFETLGVTPMLGRTFREGEDVLGQHNVIVLSHGLWQRRWGGDSSVVGRSVNINGVAREIIGVLPPDVRYPPPAELYVPLAMSDAAWRALNNHYLLVTGRLAPGATVQQAHAEAVATSARLAERSPETNTRWSANVKPLVPDVTRQFRPAIIALLGAVGFVLLIACANTANLMLARGLAREGELAVCAALGAGRMRLARRVLAESVILALAGGVLGVTLGIWGVDALLALVPMAHGAFLPGFSHIRVDAPVLAFTAAITVVTVLLFGMLPAVRAARVGDTGSRLRTAGRAIAGSRHRTRAALVAAEVGGALVLLVGAGLMVRTFQYLSSRDTGVDPRGAAVMTIALPPATYPDNAAAERFWSELAARARRTPGVTAAGLGNLLPMCMCNTTESFAIDGAPPFAPGDEPDVGYRVITPGFHDALGIRMLRGRGFTADDRPLPGAPPVVLVNAALERRYFPDGALGRRIRLGDTARYEIVGVVADVRHNGPASEATPELYVAAAQRPAREMAFVTRAASGDASSLLPVMRALVAELDPNLPVFGQDTMEGALRLAIGGVRFATRLLVVMAIIALMLATIGIYGVASQMVAERRREIGIRMALGSDRRGVVAFVARRALRAVAVGTVAGLAMSLALSVLVRARTVGVDSLDPVTYALVLVVLVAAAFVATVIPARRAARVDPLVALRAD